MSVISPDRVTPIERRGDIWMKRDDLFEVRGLRGGKVRTCLHLATTGQGTRLVTASSRHSPQAAITAAVASELGLSARAYVPAGDMTPQLEHAEALGCELVRVRPGYNTVVASRARVDAFDSRQTHIPFGMECEEAVEMTSRQVRYLPDFVRRIVVPVGSAMSLCGILRGLRRHGDMDTRIVGVQVGADPLPRIERYADPFWQAQITIVKSPLSYHDAFPKPTLHGVTLDAVYEAKCIPYLQPDDLLWVVGVRPTGSV